MNITYTYAPICSHICDLSSATATASTRTSDTLWQDYERHWRIGIVGTVQKRAPVLWLVALTGVQILIMQLKTSNSLDCFIALHGLTDSAQPYKVHFIDQSQSFPGAFVTKLSPAINPTRAKNSIPPSPTTTIAAPNVLYCP